MESSIHVLIPECGEPVVMRRYLDQASFADACALAAREAAVLRVLESTSVSAPALVALDPYGEHCGAPTVLMSLVDGQRKVPDDLRTLAAELARSMANIHAVSPSGIEDLPDETELVVTALVEERPHVALVLGSEAGTLVLQAYEAEVGGPLTDRAWWDLVAAARVEPDLSGWTESTNYFGSPDVTVQDVAHRFTRFVRDALAAS